MLKSPKIIWLVKRKKIPNRCLRNVLISLQICFTIVTCFRMLTNPYNAVANLMNALRIKHCEKHDTCVAYLHIHIAGLSFCFLFARLCAISLFPIILILIVRILSLYYENINTNASESLQRLTIATNSLPLIRMACKLHCTSEYVANMRLYEF